MAYNDNTGDYPGLYVVRMHYTLPSPKPTAIAFSHLDLAKVRGMLPPAPTRLNRQEGDDPVILETWL